MNSWELGIGETYVHVTLHRRHSGHVVVHVAVIHVAVVHV